MINKVPYNYLIIKSIVRREPKYIDIKLHFIRNAIELRKVIIIKVDSSLDHYFFQLRMNNGNEEEFFLELS